MKSQRIRLLWVVGATLALIGCSPEGGIGGTTISGGTTSGGTDFIHGDTSCVTPADAEALGKQVLLLVNQTRREYGLNQLTWSEPLAQIAGDYACTMIRGDFFDHVNPSTGEGPGERAIKAGYLFMTLGENLAGGQPTPSTVMQAWMESESHRENILNPVWDELGVGMREGGEYGIYWVQEFGDPP